MSNSTEPPSVTNPTTDFVLSRPDIYPVVEGYETAKALKDLAKKLDIKLDVLGRIGDVLKGDLDPRDLISTIMTQPVGPEFDGNIRSNKDEGPIPAAPLSFPPLPPRSQRRQELLGTLQAKAFGKQPGEMASLDLSSTALLMIEFQNEFTTMGGKMADSTQKVMAATGMLANSVKVCDAARSRGVCVLHAPIMFERNYTDNPNRGFGVLKSVCDGQLFPADTWNSDYHPSMKPRDGDLVVIGKRGLDSFPHSNLEELLRARRITTLVIGGFLTSCCVESTMRTAYEKGYNVITLVDCCADTSMDMHKAATEGTFKLFSTPMTADAFIAAHLR